MNQPIQDHNGIDLGGRENKGYVLEKAVQLLRGRDADIKNLRAV